MIHRKEEEKGRFAMMFKIVCYKVDDVVQDPSRLMLVDVESHAEGLILAKRVLGLENTSDVRITEFVGQVPPTAKVYMTHMNFEEMFDLGLATAL